MDRRSQLPGGTVVEHPNVDIVRRACKAAGLAPGAPGGVGGHTALVAEVVTLLLIIQYLEETDALDAIVVINHGRVNRRGTSAELKAATGAGGDRQRP
jgi:hypothetical protein